MHPLHINSIRYGNNCRMRNTYTYPALRCIPVHTLVMLRRVLGVISSDALRCLSRFLLRLAASKRAMCNITGKTCYMVSMVCSNSMFVVFC